MKNITKKQLLAQIRESNISRRIDKMDLYGEIRFFAVEEAKRTASDKYNRKPRSILTCRVYVTSKSGMYGYQFMAAIWAGNGQATGSLTGGYGYDKISTAVSSAVDALGIGEFTGYFGGTGEHYAALEKIARKLAGRKAIFSVCFGNIG